MYCTAEEEGVNFPLGANKFVNLALIRGPCICILTHVKLLYFCVFEIYYFLIDTKRCEGKF